MIFLLSLSRILHKEKKKKKTIIFGIVIIAVGIIATSFLSSYLAINY